MHHAAAQSAIVEDEALPIVLVNKRSARAQAWSTASYAIPCKRNNDIYFMSS